MSAQKPWPKQRLASAARTGLLVVASIALTTLVRLSLAPLLGRRVAFLMYFPALVFSAWVGGWGGGLTAVALSTLVATYLFISPTHTLAITNSIDQVTLVIFLIVGLGVSAISSAQRRARQQALEAAAEARHSAEALAESEARYRRLLETANEGIHTTNAEDRITYSNPRMGEMVGYTPEELRGRSLYDLLFPEDVAQTQERRARRRQGIQEQYELRLRRRDGTALWAVANVTVQREGGEYAGTFGLFTDISARKALEAEREALLIETQARAEREEMVNHIGEAIRATTDPERVQEVAAALLGQALGADRCYFSVYDPMTDAVRIARDWRRPGLPSVAGEYRLAQYQGYVDLLYARGTAAIADSQAPDVDPTVGRVLTGFGLRAFLAVPLLDAGRFVAAVAASMSDAARAWTPAEISLMETVLTQTRTAAEAARAQQRERTIATQLADALLPAVPSGVPGLALAKHFEPALALTEGVGGDFYDVFPLGGSHGTALVVGDLSGKGLAAAAQVATVRNSLRATLYLGRTLAGSVGDLNRILCAHDLLSGFATLFVGRYDGAAGVLTYVNCGQEPGLVRRAATGRVEELLPTGPVLGAAVDAVFAEQAVTLAPGDALAVFTDGVTECGASRSEMLGIAGAAALLSSPFAPDEATSPARMAEAVTARLMAGVNAASRGGVARDDVCLLVGVAC